MAYQRLTDYQNSGDFLAQEVNDDFDRLWLAVQQNSEGNDRAIVKPITDSASIDMTLPSSADRANSFLTFDATGAPSVTRAGDPAAPSSIVRQQFTGDGATLVYTLASAPGALGQSMQVFIDGVYQENDTYSVSGTSLTFSEAPPLNASIETVAFEVNAIGETSSNLVSYTPAGSGAVQTTVQSKLRETVSVKDFGAVGDGVTDDTAAIQAAIDSGLPFTIPWGSYLVTDSLEIDETKGCTIVGEARTVPNTSTFPRLIFQPSTKRDMFIWKNLPASYAFAAVKVSGLSVRGEGAGAAAVFNLPRLYRGNLDAYIYTGIDHYAIVERWLDCNVTGNINGFRSSAFRIVNTGLSSSNITTRTDFDVYISGGDPSFTTYGFDIETFSIIGGRITNMIESVDCAIRMARGNTIDSAIYTENTPRTNAGALFEIGKIDTGTPDGTTVFTHNGVNLHGTNVAAPGYNATLFADIDYCTTFSISGCNIKRFGALLKTTANSKNISFSNSYAIGVDLLELTTSDIADMSEITFSAWRTVGMFSPHGGAGFQNTNIITTTGLNPQGVTRPRWAYDRLYSTSSQSFWTSIGDGLLDWRLDAPQTFTGSAVVSPGTIGAGASHQANVTVSGALGGDFAIASWGALYSGIEISARVTAADTVTVTLTNVTGASIATITATLRVMVTKVII